MDRLLARFDQRLAAGRNVVAYRLDPSAGAALAWLYAHGEVVSRRDKPTGLEIDVALESASVARFAERFKIEPLSSSGLPTAQAS
jgi:GTP-binding protein HflX